jgi:Protein-tyrosine-phosphatase
MAWGLLQDKLAKRGLQERIQVETAGTFALEGKPPTPEGQAVLAERGIDISTHRARTVNVGMLRAADLVIVMAEEHRKSLFYHDPASLHKILLLSELAGDHRDIEDPYGRSRDAYEATAEIIDRYLETGLEAMLRRLGIEENQPLEEAEERS